MNWNWSLGPLSEYGMGTGGMELLEWGYTIFCLFRMRDGSLAKTARSIQPLV